MTTEIDVVVYMGNVMLREWEGGELVQTHTCTPKKARSLSRDLAFMADEADKQMPHKAKR
jgi:hypothetical protein